ncbi:transporter substrate-binding domain-containing protein [Streptomyces sp. M10(2022)]
MIEALLQKNPGRRPAAAQTEEMLLAVTNDSPVLYTPPLHPAPVPRLPRAPAAAPAASPAAAEPAAEPAPVSAPSSVPPSVSPASGPSSAPPSASPRPGSRRTARPASGPASVPPPRPRPRRPVRQRLPRHRASGSGPGRRRWRRHCVRAAGRRGLVRLGPVPRGYGITEQQGQGPGYLTFKQDGHDTLKIGIKGDQPGLSERDGTHMVKGREVPKYKGYEIDLGYKIARKMGYPAQDVSFTEVVTANRASALDRKEVDLILATFSINKERLENDKISMVGPYYNAGQSFLIREIHKEKFNDPSDLQDKDLQVCTAGGRRTRAGSSRRATTSRWSSRTKPASTICWKRTTRSSR